MLRIEKVGWVCWGNYCCGGLEVGTVWLRVDNERVEVVDGWMDG